MNHTERTFQECACIDSARWTLSALCGSSREMKLFQLCVAVNIMRLDGFASGRMCWHCSSTGTAAKTSI